MNDLGQNTTKTGKTRLIHSFECNSFEYHSFNLTTSSVGTGKKVIQFVMNSKNPNRASLNSPTKNCFAGHFTNLRTSLSLILGHVRCLLRVRLSSDAVLLPCRTELQLVSEKVREKHNFDSDVAPESYQIQDFLKSRNKYPRNFPRKRSPTKIP